MAQKREKEETELNIPQMCKTAPMIPPPQQLPAARLLEKPDPKVLETIDDRTSSASSPEKQKPDPVADRSSMKRPREVNRCSGSGCKKRVGLVGFRCRCGEVFCSEHRYSDRHDCSFDYKAAGREAIAKENPVVRAAKLLKV